MNRSHSATTGHAHLNTLLKITELRNLVIDALFMQIFFKVTGKCAKWCLLNMDKILDIAKLQINIKYLLSMIFVSHI